MGREHTTAPKPGRTGRRPGPNRTREAILRTARTRFGADGYDAVSIRAVAHEAGVDPALVHRFFGSKQSLFVAAMQLPVAPGELVRALLANGTEGLGERIVQTLITINDTPGAVAPFLALLRASTSNEQAATMLREFVTTEVLGPIAAAAAPDEPDLRAALAGSQVIGLAIARYVIVIPQIANARPTSSPRTSAPQSRTTSPAPCPGRHACDIRRP